MKVNLYAMFDRTSSLHHAPFVSVNGEAAKRQMASTFARPGNQFYDFYEDYDLHHLGTFSDETGIIEPAEKSTCVCTGEEIAKQTFRNCGSLLISVTEVVSLSNFTLIINSH